MSKAKKKKKQKSKFMKPDYFENKKHCPVLSQERSP